MSNTVGTKKQSHHVAIPMIVIFFLMLLTIAIILYPPLMILGLDVAVIGGAILLVAVIANIWRHEIKRLAHVMHDIEEYLKVHPAQQEECEQYYVLSSIDHSMNLLEQKKDLSINEKKRLRYLKKQKIINACRRCKRGIIWALKLLVPFHINGYPTLLDNLKTIFHDPKFLALRMTILVWSLFSLFILLFWL